MSAQPLSQLSYAQRLGLNSDQFSSYVKQMLAKARVALPCIVQSFDSVTQTVSVLPAVMERVYQNIDGIPTPQDMPWNHPFGHLPVVFPKAGGFVLTMPPQSGDECLAIFADYCIDSWWQSGGTGNAQLDKRRHDLSDGFALMGVWSQPNLISDFNASAAELRTLDGTVKITLASTGVTITGAASTSANLDVGGSLKVNGNIGFYNDAPVGKPTITGSKSGNAALTSLLSALALMGLVTDSTT